LNLARRRTTPSLALLVVASLLLAACGGTPSARPAAPASSGAAPSGSAPSGGATGGAPSAPAQQAAPASGAQPAQGTQAAIRPEFQDAMRLSIDELHQRALGEGGSLAYYGTLAQINAEKILPAFEARFPGIKVEHIDATGERLAARIIAEARGGRTLADVYEANLSAALQLHQQGLLLQALPPEADAYPDDLKGSFFLGMGLTALVVAWNTSQVAAADAPRQIEDVADPKWRGRLIAEPQDTEFLIGLGRKLGSQDRAVEVLRRIAANEPEFHRGHSELAELLIAGQAAVCFTCYSHHYPSRMRRGAPVDYLIDEGIAQITATAVLKDAPRPYSAMLWQRYMHTEEGQRMYAEGGRTPAHPNVAPTERVKPDRIYGVTEADLNQLAQYERQWKEIFQLR
jgi:iron(III) transport system substrate-binding protein